MPNRAVAVSERALSPAVYTL